MGDMAPFSGDAELQTAYQPTARDLTTADLQPTGDGSLTLHSRRFGQTYGSAHGAEAQAQQVFVGGTGVADSVQGRILEIGFGVGQNLRATLAARGERRALDYLAYEFDPVPQQVLAQLSQGAAGTRHPLWGRLIEAWPPAVGESLTVAAGMGRVQVVCGDALTAPLPEAWADAVYLDGFSPQANPELWSAPFLARVAGAMRSGGVLATYSAAGEVRRRLAAAGLTVQKFAGPAGKRECVRALKP